MKNLNHELIEPTNLRYLVKGTLQHYNISSVWKAWLCQITYHSLCMIIIHSDNILGIFPQNGQPLNTEVTSGLTEAPVPNLNPGSNDPSASQTSAILQQQPITGSMLTSTTEHKEEEDEFADFQAAPRSGEGHQKFSNNVHIFLVA